MSYETVTVPFKTFGNRRGLTSFQLVEEPWLSDFVKSFPDCWEYNINQDVALFIEDDK